MCPRTYNTRQKGFYFVNITIHHLKVFTTINFKLHKAASENNPLSLSLPISGALFYSAASSKIPNVLCVRIERK